MAKADGSAIKELMKIEKYDLLILDDFGILPLDTQSRAMMLMDIMEDRHRQALYRYHLAVTGKTTV